jgi:biopolymer transport protein ExbD
MPLLYLTFEIDHWFIPLEEKMDTRFVAPAGAARNFPFTEGVNGTRSANKWQCRLQQARVEKAEMNVTPLIDDRRVAGSSDYFHGHHTVVVQRHRCSGSSAPQSKVVTDDDDIVISVLGDRTVRINGETVAIADLSNLDGRVQDRRRSRRVRSGPKKLDFEQIADVIDIATGAGLDRIALLMQ